MIIKSNFSILDLLNKYKLDNKNCDRHNGIIIQRSNYRKKYLKENDKVEIVHFIGGG